MMIGYTKIYDTDKNPYIILINVDQYIPISEVIFNSECAMYKTFKYYIIRIENIDGIDIEKIGSFEIDKTYTKEILFWFRRDIAFNHKFIENKEYLFLKEGYSGLYTEYYIDGNLRTKYYHTNGLINGECKLYYNNIFIQTFYVNGKLHDTKKIYNNNILNYECIYDNNKIIGEEKTYYYSGEIKQIKNYDNNIITKYWKNCKIRYNYFNHEKEYCPRYFCTCENRQLNPHSRWLTLELEERHYSRFNEFMCKIIKFFTHEDTEEEIKNKNKKRREKTDELRKKYGLIEDIVENDNEKI